MSCSTVVDDICLSDLNKRMGIFVVCQLQLNSVTLFLICTVHVCHIELDMCIYCCMIYMHMHEHDLQTPTVVAPVACHCILERNTYTYIHVHTYINNTCTVHVNCSITM